MASQAETKPISRTLTGTLSHFDTSKQSWLITPVAGGTLAVLSEDCRKSSGALEAFEGAQIIYEIPGDSHIVTRVVKIEERAKAC